MVVARQHLGRADEPPRVSDDFELAGRLGSGSSGSVWDGWQRSTGARVAIKVISPQLLTSRQARRRFEREVKSAALLRHPHCVRFLSHGITDEGAGYLVMERLSGVTLAERLHRDGPMPQALAIKVALETLDALAAMHAVGFVHRDIKPANLVLVEQDGDPDFVKVCDYGLVKPMLATAAPDSREGWSTLTTEQGEVCGTPGYMPPEQARGEDIDARADLYALAAVLYQCLTARAPFPGRSALAVVSQQLMGPPPRLSVAQPELRIFPALESLVLRALSRDRAERPSSARVFQADLAQIAQDAACAPAREQDGPELPATVRAVSLWPAAWIVRVLPRPAIAVLMASAVALAILYGSVRSRHESVKAGAAQMLAAQTLVPQPDSKSLQATATTSVAASVLPRPSAARTSASASAVPSSVMAPRSSAHTETSKLADAERLLASGELASACALAERVGHARPSPKVSLFLGRCYMRLGDSTRARAHYRDYLQADPDGRDAVFVRAIVGDASP